MIKCRKSRLLDEVSYLHNCVFESQLLWGCALDSALCSGPRWLLKGFTAQGRAPDLLEYSSHGHVVPAVCSMIEVLSPLLPRGVSLERWFWIPRDT